LLQRLPPCSHARIIAGYKPDSFPLKNSPIGYKSPCVFVMSHLK
jgi:hypothetical protein